MSTPAENQPRRERSWIYITSCVLLAIMTIWAVLAFSGARQTKRANEKADAFIAALHDAGAARTPSTEQVARVLGDDGGATCENPNKALSRATLFSMLTNGAAGPGARPVIADTRLLQGQKLIIQTYCPDQLEEFQNKVNDLKTAHVTDG
jgi:Tfp pilus assembly protein FimT